MFDEGQQFINKYRDFAICSKANIIIIKIFTYSCDIYNA